MRLLGSGLHIPTVIVAWIAITLTAGNVPAQQYFGAPISTVAPLGSLNRESLVVDVDNDGFLDVVQSSGVPPGMACLLGPTLTSIAYTAVGTTWNDVISPIGTPDLNADGFRDVVGFSVNGLRNLLGNGNGSFTPGPIVPGTQVAAAGRSFALTDLDGDSSVELVGVIPNAGTQTSTVAIWTNFNGGWSSASAFQVPFSTYTLATGDVDGDGAQDIVLANILSPPVYWTGICILPGIPGLGFNFGPPIGPVQNSLAEVVVTRDLDADGDDDVLLTSSSGGFRILRGAPGFAMAVNQLRVFPFYPGTPPFATSSYNFGDVPPLVRDFDRDGILDVFAYGAARVVISPTNSTIRLTGFLYFGTGPDLSSTPVLVDPGPIAQVGAFGAGDMDGDGDQDLVIARDRIWPAPAGTIDFEIRLNLGTLGPGIPGTLGLPTIKVGSPVLGNSGFSVELTSALPQSLAVLGISLATAMTGSPTGALWLDTRPGQLLFPQGNLGVFVTDAFGGATAPMAIPAIPSAAGLEFFTQWAVVDPAGLSPFGTIPLALSDARKVILRIP